MIALIGKLFAFGVTLSILLISFQSYIKKAKLTETLLWISTVFALFSLILHPWYIALVILFATLTRYKFGVLWSLLIMSTYAGYSAIGFQEIMAIVAIEFVAILVMILYEIRKYRYAKLNAK